MKAHLISIGNELLIGDTINTNAAWLGRELLGCGIQTEKVIAIGDDEQEILSVLDDSTKVANVIIITGGLGPTHDDITKTALARFFKVGYRTDEQTLNYIKEVFRKRNIPFSESNEQQAQVPETCTVLFNKAGTAPGMWFEENDTIVISLPGVPSEMKYLMTEYVLPALHNRVVDGKKYVSSYLHLAGIGESTLSDLRLKEVRNLLQNGISMAYLPGRHGITLRISTYAESEQAGRDQIAVVSRAIVSQASEFVYSNQKEDSLAAAVGRLLVEKNKTVAVAESCSGGFLSNALTNIPGSSAYMLGGIIAYNNSLKTQFLNVPPRDLETYGAVSKPVALQMAKHVAVATGADFGLATTGIAGPGGGTPEKPVGLVWLGFWSQNEHFAIRLQLFRDRLANKERSAIVAMDVLRRKLQGITSYPYDVTPEFA